MVKEGTSKSIQNSCIAFYCQKFKGGLFGSCQKYYKTFWEYLSYCMRKLVEVVFMRNDKKTFDEIINDILTLIVIIGFATFGIGCVIDSIFIWIAIFTGKIMISANTYILLMGVPAVGTPAIFLLSLLIIRVMKFFVK